MTAALSPVARQETSVGAGAKLYAYTAGGAITPQATYSDYALSVPNSQPMVADANGRFGPIFLQPALYYFKLTDANDITQWTQDNVADFGQLLNASVTSLQTAQPSIVFCSSQLNATTNTTLAAVVGLSQTVATGTYQFAINLSGTATVNGGWKVAFKYTTAVLSGMECVARGFTASGLVVQHSTSTSDSASLLASTTAIINGELVGRFVVSTGGSVQVDFAQNASHADTSSVYVGSSFSLVKTA